jgi:predicted nucleic acid-binding protein
MVIIDTSVWIDYLGNQDTLQVRWLEREMDGRKMGITDLSLCEILQGIRHQGEYIATRDALLEYEIFPAGGAELAIAAAHNYRQLRAEGCTVRTTIDCLIATFCIQHDFPLLHNDKDFDPFEEHLGLQVIHP